MQAHQHQSHYEPVSVGGLMETDFLRDVAHGDDTPHPRAGSAEKPAPRWRHLMESLTSLLTRRR